MGEENGAAQSHGTLWWAIRTAGIAGFFGLALVHHFTQPDRTPPAPIHVAQSGTGRSLADPDTTGSIAQGARAGKLDPCGSSAGMRVSRP